VKYLLDTDTCIYLIRAKDPQVLNRLRALSFGDVGVSAITVAELQYGAQKSQRPTQNRRALEQFLAPLVVADFDYAASERSGGIRAALEQSGTPIGSLDTLIAAHALSLDVSLVTNNEREFSRVPGLRVVNWVSSSRE